MAQAENCFDLLLQGEMMMTIVSFLAVAWKRGRAGHMKGLGRERKRERVSDVAILINLFMWGAIAILIVLYEQQRRRSDIKRQF